VKAKIKSKYIKNPISDTNTQKHSYARLYTYNRV